MQHFLMITDRKGNRTVELTESSGSIGRDPANSIAIDASEVSRQHAILMRVTHPGETEHEFRIIDGDFQGKPSTNGLFVNGRRVDSRTLQHGDEITLGTSVTASYLTAHDDTNTAWLLSGSDEAVDHLATLSAQSSVESETSEADRLHYSALTRLASFPELFIHPIIEFSVEGEITYHNPAAIQQFPEIKTEKTNHPLLLGAIEAATQSDQERVVREVCIGERIFEQSLSYIPQSELIRSYLVDITDRKRAEHELKILHDKLEATIEKRTLQFNEASNRLRREEKALVASYATNRALLNAIPDPMFRIDYAGNVVNFKAPKQHTLPFDPSQSLDQHVSAILPDKAAQNIQTCIGQALKTGKIQVLEFQLPDDKTTVDFEARIAVSAPNETVVIMRDITERKKGEAEIKRALNRERDLNEMKTRFVSMTSHEFRTPLTTILSSAELIEHYGDRCSNEKKLQFLNKIQTAAKHMTSLLNDVLLINKADAGKAEFKPKTLDLTAFCSEIIEELQITTDNHQLIMRSQISNISVPIDQKLMRHILTNLLSNAINYSPNGGEITVSLSQQDSEVELRVKDSGIGIPEESKATLFESFVRGGNVGTISGTGLGLAIVKKSVDLHQGHIDCLSSVGEGTTFIIRLPLTPKPIVELPQKTAQPVS